MNDKSGTELEGDGREPTNRIVLKGRVKKREKHAVEIELVNGLIVDIETDDYTVIEETTDPVTVRPTITVELHGKRPITVTFQPHLYRVLAGARTVPFVFSGVSGDLAGGSILGLAYIGRAAGGGGGTDHGTRVMCTTWWGTRQEDGTKADSPGEPDEEDIP